MIEDFLTQRFGDIVGRIHGPMNFRIYIQTLVAVVLAVRAGLRDAREGNPPYFWALASNPDHRRALLHGGWKDIAKLFAAVSALDVVYQIIALHMVYPLETVVVATLLAVIPYLIVRAAVTRLLGNTYAKK